VRGGGNPEEIRNRLIEAGVKGPLVFWAVQNAGLILAGITGLVGAAAVGWLAGQLVPFFLESLLHRGLGG
jgi:hypothetical protein